MQLILSHDVHMAAADDPPNGTAVPSTEPDDEEAFLATYDPRAFDPVAVTVDIVVLTIRQGQLCVLLVRRGAHPAKGAWALPGGFATAREDLDGAAERIFDDEFDRAPARPKLEPRRPV